MKNKVVVLVELAVCVALTVVCSFIKVWEMPQGGSIALTMIPLLLIAFRRGPVAGIITGAVYGLISAFVLSSAIYHPLSILLDYVLAFGLIGVAGFFKKTPVGIVCGSLAGVGCRFVSSVVSGAVLFASYAPEGMNPWIYSIVYQVTYMLPELVISLAVIMFLYFKARKVFAGL